MDGGKDGARGCASKAWQAAQASCQIGLIGCRPGLSGVFRGESDWN